MAELHDLTAAQAGDRIREGEVSSVDLCQALLNRIDPMEPTLKAWVTIDREELLGEARQRDRELEEKGPRGPLHGVPVGLKDIFYTAGMRTTAGSKVYADFVPSYDATCVARLKDAGAVVLGKAVTTEFATGDPSPSRNAWNLAHTPGGSSSGSAVAVSTRMVAAALGSQTGGSTCRPASYNGIVGLKPSYGRISRYGVVPVSWSVDTVGILVRTVEDAAVMLGAMAGHDPNDPGSSSQPVPDYRAALGSLSGPPRIGLIREFFLEYCDDEVRRNTEAAAEKLAGAGATVTEVGLPKSFAANYAAHGIIQAVDCATFHEEFFRRQADDYSPKLRATIEMGMLVPAVRYMQAQRMRRRFAVEMAEAARGFDALLTPSTPAEAPRDLTTTGDPAFQRPWTSSGLPTISLPSGLSANGLPLGIQLEGAPFDEARLLAVAAWCEEALDVRLAPPDSW